jgi:hypothetical protein
MALPDFVGYGEKGKQQLDNMMQFFDENPEFRTLMPEQFRFVDYYQNLKAAVDTARSEQEKEYLQALMNQMVYDMSYLANNQQRPNIQSYADYKQMYA